MGAQYLFKSTDRGSSWTKISGDLTLGIDRDTLKMMGKVVGPDALSRHDGQSNYGSLTSIGESPLDAKVIWTGSDDGQVQVTRDGGRTWTNVTSHIQVPEQTYVSTVLPSRHKASRVYATFDGHYTDDYHPYVFVSEDFGATWKAIVTGLPETSVNRIREHPRNARVLVVGHERGAHVSNDGGTTWIPLAGPGAMLPTVSVDDAVFQERDNALVLGTHGRGIWVLDDVGPLETLTAGATRADALLMPIPRARLMSTFTPQAWYGHGEFFAPNPEWNAVIAYHVREGASGPAEIAINDGSVKAIRTLRGPATKGVNRVVWDLRYAAPVDSTNVPPAGGRGGGGGRGGPPAATPVGFPVGGEGGGRGNAPLGPLVLPGRYAVSVKIPGVSEPLAGTVVVESDPLPRFTDGDRVARQATLMSIYAWSKTLGDARLAIRSLVGQRDSLRADLAASADSINARVMRLSGDIDRAFNAVNTQRGPIEGWSGLPTIDQRKALGYAIEGAQKAIGDLNALVTTQIPTAYRDVAKKPWPRAVQRITPP
jgi:photosystem II stability/assembly factor-like uncharacterized protein